MGGQLPQPRLSPGPRNSPFSLPGLECRRLPTVASPEVLHLVFGSPNPGHTLITLALITRSFGHPRLNCHLCRYATEMDADFPLLPNPSCRLLPLFSPSTPLHPSALIHPPARGPDPLPRHTGSSARGRPCLDLQGTPAQGPASRQLSEAVKVSLNESGQWRGKTVTSTPASEVCLQHTPLRGMLRGVCSGAVPPLPRRPVRAPAALRWGGVSSTMGRGHAPAPPILQHLSACPELTDGRAPLLLAPIQAAW